MISHRRTTLTHETDQMKRWQEAQAAVKSLAKADDPIPRLRRNHGLPERGRINARWTDNGQIGRIPPKVFRHMQRDQDDPMGAVVAIFIILIGAVIGATLMGLGVMLFGWQPW